MRDSTKIHILTATVIILAIAVVLLLCIRGFFGNNDMVVDPHAIDIIHEIDEKGSSEGGISVIGFKEIKVEANSSEISSFFINPDNNAVYFVASLYLEDGTLLYKSKLIPPGMAIYNIKISQPLEEGRYNAVVYYDTYSIDTFEKKNTAKISFVIIAEND